MFVPAYQESPLRACHSPDAVAAGTCGSGLPHSADSRPFHLSTSICRITINTAEMSKDPKYLPASRAGKCSKFTGPTKYLPARLFREKIVIIALN